MKQSHRVLLGGGMIALGLFCCIPAALLAHSLASLEETFLELDEQREKRLSIEAEKLQTRLRRRKGPITEELFLDILRNVYAINRKTQRPSTGWKYALVGAAFSGAFFLVLWGLSLFEIVYKQRKRIQDKEQFETWLAEAEKRKRAEDKQEQSEST